MPYWSTFFKIQLVIVHGLGVLNAIHAAFKVRHPQAAIGWALGLVTFPYFAIPSTGLSAGQNSSATAAQ